MTTELLSTIAIYAAIGAVYGSSGYAHSIAEGEKTFKPDKFISTVVIGILAGAIVALQGDEFTTGSFEAAMAIAVPIADQVKGAVGDYTQ